MIDHTTTSVETPEGDTRSAEQLTIVVEDMGDSFEHTIDDALQSLRYTHRPQSDSYRVVLEGIIGLDVTPWVHARRVNVSIQVGDTIVCEGERMESSIVSIDAYRYDVELRSVGTYWE